MDERMLAAWACACVCWQCATDDLLPMRCTSAFDPTGSAVANIAGSSGCTAGGDVVNVLFAALMGGFALGQAAPNLQ